ncbi:MULTISPECIES: DUF2520 domain-containing protein [Arthrobacter]|uniref:DUF2520 domain-containing protein n=2 Tax=Arthrobacter TaxID=1663 RepID=A0ABU9KIN6_9MICC|nr:DUF2520 domain-containing protein [Arthrobacter sp. YJM1]MDP5226996.1 DUF2520 domain-containing protein [Arthrobacter sp. YJM1]
MREQLGGPSGSAPRAGRLRVGVIGAGKVGAVLGAALRAAEHAVTGVTAVSEASRERAENLLPGVPVLEAREIVAGSDLVLLAVPDDVLSELVAGLASLGAWKPGQLVAHTSGRYGVGVLEPVRAAGAIPLSIHPAMTFTGLSLDLGRLTDCVFGVTADAPMLPIAQALVIEMGGEPVVIPEEQRVLYHAALAHGSNHLVTLASQAAQLLAEIGVAEPERLLAPLLRASLDNALASGESALTGPVSRGDAGTVASHREALTGRDALLRQASEDDGGPRPGGHLAGAGDDILESYLAMARATLQRAVRQDRLRAEQAAALGDVLG